MRMFHRLANTLHNTIESARRCTTEQNTFVDGREEWDTMTEVARDGVGERGQDMGETIAEYLQRQGREQGREEGRLEGSRVILLKQIAWRFPERETDEIRQKLEAIREVSGLEELAERLLRPELSWEELWAPVS